MDGEKGEVEANYFLRGESPSIKLLVILFLGYIVFSVSLAQVNLTLGFLVTFNKNLSNVCCFCQRGKIFLNETCH